MVRLSLRHLASVAAALVAGVATATADPIQITSGSLVFPSSPTRLTVELSGAGFTFTGNTGTQQLWLSPYGDCLVPACVPGSTVSLRTAGSEATYGFATATYQGQTFDNFGGINARSGLVTEWTGALELPENFAGGSLSAPFSFSGFFRLTDDQTGSVQPRAPHCVHHAVRALRLRRRRRHAGACLTAAPLYGSRCHRGCQAAISKKCPVKWPWTADVCGGDTSTCDATVCAAPP
jgi:hypothetical protein